jgi:hypothetical protein
MKRFWFILAAFLGLTMTAVPAMADTVYTLSCNDAPCTGSAGGHNYGTVTLHESVVNNTWTVTVDLAAPGAVAGETFANSSSGFAIAWDLNVTPDSVVIDAGTVHSGSFAVQPFNGSYKAAPFTSGANGNNFNYAIDYTGATGTSGDNKLVFDVTRATGLALLNFVANPNYRFTVDIALSSGDTFNVAVKAPEPQTWLLFLAGLAGLTLLVQRRRKLARAA